jgi:hypothetical protein
MILLLTSISLQAQPSINPSFQIEQRRIVQIAFPLKQLPVFKKEYLALLVGKQNQVKQGQPSILGSFQVQDSSLFFQPRFPLEGGRFYTLKIKEDNNYSFWIAYPEKSVPSIQHIYPSGDQLPANLLKFYLHFSEPMQAGNSYQQIVLVNQDSDTIEAPFVVLSPELWNDDFTRLTLWIDPGRIKRDLGPNQAYGPVLNNRQRYELIIKDSWKNQHGVPLSKTYHKHFRVVPADRKQLSIKNWQLSLPKAASQAALEISFKRPMDAALLQRMIQVYGPNNEQIECSFSLGPQEKSLEIKPAINWESIKYTLKIDSYLEDVSGNNLLRPFDRDLRKKPSNTAEQDFYYLPFQPTKTQ